MSPRVQVVVTIALALLIPLVMQAGLVATQFEGRATGLFRIARFFCARGPYEILDPIPWLYGEGLGYDGQFFYFLAHDPLLLNERLHLFLDLPEVRARRIGYPALAWVCALGVAKLIPYSLFALNMLGVVGCVVLLGRRAREAGLPFVYGLVFVLCTSTAMVMTVVTCEVVATFFLLLAFASHRARRPLPTLGATLAAVLCKEICLLWLGALVVHAVASRRPRFLVGCLAVGLLWGAWAGYVVWRMPEPISAVSAVATAPAVAGGGESGAVAEAPAVRTWRFRLGFFGLPFKGAGEQVIAAFRAPSELLTHRLHELGLMLTLIAMGVRGVARLRRTSARDPVALLFAVAGACAICLNRGAWDWSGNFARQLFPLLAVALWTLPLSRPAKVDTYGHVFFSLWKAVVKVVMRIL